MKKKPGRNAPVRGDIKYALQYLPSEVSYVQLYRDVEDCGHNCELSDRHREDEEGEEQISDREWGNVIYELLRSENKGKLASIVSDWIIGAGAMETVDALNDTTPYYLIKKDGLKLLVNIHDYILEVIELPENTNDKKFVYGKNKFKQFKKLELTK